MSHDTDIEKHERRVEEITDRLESDDDLSLAEATELRDEANDHINVLEEVIRGTSESGFDRAE